MRKYIKQIISIFLLFTPLWVHGQETARPKVWGIARMTYLVSDFKVAREYYGDFLGFDEAFSYNSPMGRVLSFKINDRQFLEFIEDKEAQTKTRLVAVWFETDEPEQMRRYLDKCKIPVPESTLDDGAGNGYFLVHDPSGVPVAFMNYSEKGLHVKSKGKCLSDRRISERIHHAGLYSNKVMDNDPFYAGALGFITMWRYPEDIAQKPDMMYLQIPDCIENIEHYPSSDPNFSHPCFLVTDMQQTVYTLKSRLKGQTLSKPKIGRGNRWLLNLSNADKTKVEFTEPYTVR